jgi:hypothetical protein
MPSTDRKLKAKTSVAQTGSQPYVYAKGLIYTCTLLESERSSLDKHITAEGGSWPTTNTELVITHIDAFTRFVKSIDFNKLQ